MRKRFKLKDRSCPMCKPHKMGWETRFNAKDLDRLNRDEKEMQSGTKVTSIYPANTRPERIYSI